MNASLFVDGRCAGEGDEVMVLCPIVFCVRTY